MQSLKEIEKYVVSYTPRGLLVDTNVLILFLIGQYNTEFIQKIGRLSGYSADDFEILKKVFFIFSSRKLIITPQVIAELSNLTITKGMREGGKCIIAYLKTVIDFLKSSLEEHQKIDCLYDAQIEILGRYGFTDMTMFELAKKEKLPIITDDLNLHIYASSNGVPVINFQHVKNFSLNNKVFGV